MVEIDPREPCNSDVMAIALSAKLRTCPSCRNAAKFYGLDRTAGDQCIGCKSGCVDTRLGPIEEIIELWNALPRRDDFPTLEPGLLLPSLSKEPVIDARTLLAGLAMAGLLANGGTICRKEEEATVRARGDSWIPSDYASIAIEHADALLAELAKETPDA